MDIDKQIDQLFSSILISQQQFNAIRPPDPAKIPLQEKKLAEFAQLRGRALVYPYLSSGRGHGPFSEMLDGSVKYDLINGIGFNLLGHSHPLYIRAHLEAATCDTIMCGNLLTHPEAINATSAILKTVENTKLRHFWFTCSGSLANDYALKLLWQKQAPKYKLLAFTKAFAGRSIAMQDVTYNSEYREGMPQSVQVEHIRHFDQDDPDNALAKTLADLNAAWEKDPNNYCALMIELIQGEAGFIFGPKEYYEGIFRWAQGKGLPIWIDEVQTFARTTELFAFQHFGLAEYVDIVTIAKAFQACGVLYSSALNPRPGLIAGTFNGPIAGLKAASKIVTYLTEANFYGPTGRIKNLEEQMLGVLQLLASKVGTKKISRIGGVGSMISFIIGEGSKEQTNLFLQKLFTNGIIAFSAGKNPMRVRFLLPLALTSEHLQEISQIIEKTIQEILP